MSEWFEVRGKMIPPDDQDGCIKAWWSGCLFHAMQCFKEDLGQGIEVVYFYPETNDLKERLAGLEADPSPLLETLKDHEEWRGRVNAECNPSLEEPPADFQKMLADCLAQLRAFVAVYEKAFEQRTEKNKVGHREPYIIRG